MKRTLFLLLILFVVTIAHSTEYLEFTYTQHDGWGWWNSNKLPDDVELYVSNITSSTDSVAVVLLPDAKPIRRDCGRDLYKTAWSGSGVIDESFTAHLPENIWMWVRVFEWEADTDTWTAGVADSFFIVPTSWIGGMPMFADLFSNVLDHVDLIDNIPLVVTSSMQYIDTGWPRGDTEKRDAVHAIKSVTGPRTILVAHDYIQHLRNKEAFQNFLIDSAEVWYGRDGIEFYSIYDETTLPNGLPWADNDEITESVTVDNVSKLKPYGDAMYQKNNQDQMYCFALVHAAGSHDPFEIVGVVAAGNNTVNLLRGQQRTDSPTNGWPDNTVIRSIIGENPSNGYEASLYQDETDTRPDIHGKKYEEWFSDLLYDFLYNKTTQMGGDMTQPYNEPWMDGYQNDIYFTHSTRENVTSGTYDNHVFYYYHQSGMSEYPYMINCRLNTWPAEAFSVVDSFVQWAMYSETNVNARFIDPNNTDNKTPVDLIEDAYSHALYRRDKIVRFSDNSVPHVMALCNRQNKTNSAADVDDRREFMAYTICRGLVYMKAHFDGKDAGCCIWQGELCVDEEGNIQYPGNTADDAGYYGWLGVPIEDCQYVMGTPTGGSDLVQGDFEGVTDQWLWSGTGSWSVVTDDPHGGSKCAKLEPTNVTGDWTNADLEQQITTPGDFFSDIDQWGTLSFWVRADEPRLIYVEIYDDDADNYNGKLLQRGHRYAPKGYWKRWVFRFESAGQTNNITVKFNVGNGYEPPNYQAINVYLDDIEMWNEDIWAGLSRKFENGMVLWHQQASDQTFAIPTTGLKRLNTQDIPPGEGWDDPALNTGATEPGPTVTVLSNPDGGMGGALFLFGSPVFQPATYYVDTHQQRLLKFSDRAGSEYINGVTSGTFIVEPDPTVNKGSSKVLELASNTGRRRVCYLKFNIGSYIPSDATLVKARLYLTTALTWGTDLTDTVVVYDCVDNWVESEACWNYPFSGESWTGDHGLGSPVDSVEISGTNGKEYSLSVKTLVQDVLDGNGVPPGYLNIVLTDRHGGSAAHAMASEESNVSQFRPMLLVIYNRPSSGMSLNRDFNRHVVMGGMLTSSGTQAVALPSD